MIVRSAEFSLSCGHWREYPGDGWPEVAFAGRSNVGKSSLINTLTQRKGLAHSSKTPGRTQRINFFAINESLYFVDLPGYGFAKVPPKIQREWEGMIETYLTRSAGLRAVVAILDARHEPSRLDVQLLEFLAAHAIPILPVATKVDKLKRSQRAKNLKAIERVVSKWSEAAPIAFSAETREGREELLEIIAEKTAAS